MNSAENHTHVHEASGAHSHHHSLGAIKKALAVTLVFMGVEIVFGWISNSLALLGDSAHMFTDLGSLALSWFALWLASRPFSPRKSFGYQRAEIIGALVSGLLIWLLTGMLLLETFSRLGSPPPVKGTMVTIVAVLGLFVNIYALRVLHGVREHNLSSKGAYLHVVGDLVGSICAVLSGVILIRTEFYLIDPIMTLIVCGILLWSSWKLVREALEVLMEFAPRGISALQVADDLKSIAGVVSVHDLHIWSVSSRQTALSVHLISGENPREKVILAANNILHSKYAIHHTTIQVEHPSEFDSERCFDCGNG